MGTLDALPESARLPAFLPGRRRLHDDRGMAQRPGMTTKQKRTLLSALYRDRLAKLTAQYELDVWDRRSKEAHIDALVASRLDWRVLLLGLRRDELQAICDELGLDRSGREKALLVSRIMADDDDPEVEVPSPPTPAPPKDGETSRPNVPEEYFNSRATGVELEDEPSSGTSDPEPWDPEKIRIHTKHYSLRQIVDMIAEKEVDLAPDFQRQYVWKDQQRWGLIESLLLGIPLPSFYFNADASGLMQVVDGVQRLTTIYRFVHDKSFQLGKLTYLHDLQNKGFDDLDGVFRRRLTSSQFVAHVIDPQTPYRVKFDIFRRINTGGSPLSAQEIRHCMSGPRSRKFLKQLAQEPNFIRATGGALNNHPRMADREIALRFVAFRVFTMDDYAQFGGLDEFLGKVTERIDDVALMSDKELAELNRAFSRGMYHAHLVFDEHAFRKWPLDTTRRNPINRALVETWGSVLADYEEARIEARRKALVKCARELMTSDDIFISAISGGTGDVGNVKARFTKVRTVAREVLG